MNHLSREKAFKIIGLHLISLTSVLKKLKEGSSTFKKMNNFFKSQEQDTNHL